MNRHKLPKINCDLGEGIPNEAEIFPWIDCASIACGGHFGDSASITESIKLAKLNEVKIGAHPSYPDRVNFGRKSLMLEFSALVISIKAQLDLFLHAAKEQEVLIDHIKFHGALYNDAMANAQLAQGLCKWLSNNYKNIPVFVSPGSQMLFWAEQMGVKTRLEVFGDRAYQDNYQLLPRTEPNSLFTKLEEVEKQLDLLILEKQILSNSGLKLPIKAETLCFHGDNPGLMDFLPIIREKYWK